MKAKEIYFNKNLSNKRKKELLLDLKYECLLISSSENEGLILLCEINNENLLNEILFYLRKLESKVI